MSTSGLTLSGTAMDPNDASSGNLAVAAPTTPLQPAPAPDQPQAMTEGTQPSAPASQVQAQTEGTQPSVPAAPPNNPTVSNPSFAKRMALGALMGLAHGGIGGALVGALEGVSKHQFGVMEQNQENRVEQQNAKTQTANADASTELQTRQANIQGLTVRSGLEMAQTAMISKQIADMDQTEQDAHNKSVEEMVTGFSGLLGQPQYIPGQDYYHFMSGNPNKIAIPDSHGVWVWDRANAMQNAQGMADTITAMRYIDQGPTATPVTPQQMQLELMHGKGGPLQKEYDDALGFLSSRDATSYDKAHSIEVRAGSGADRLAAANDPRFDQAINLAHATQKVSGSIAKDASAHDLAMNAQKIYQRDTILQPAQATVDGVPRQGTAAQFASLAQQGHNVSPPFKMNEGEYEKNQQTWAHFETNMSAMGDYARVYKTNDGKLTPADIEGLKVLTARDTMTQGIVAQSEGMAHGAIGDFLDSLVGQPLTGYSQKLMGSNLNADMYSKMSDGGRELLANYYSAMVASLATMKERLNTVGRNELMQQIDLHTVPLPYIGWNAAKPAFKSRAQQMQSDLKGTPKPF